MKSNLGKTPRTNGHAGHVIRITASDSRWTARQGDCLLADSRRTQVLRETGYAPVTYFPAEDVFMNRLGLTDDRSNCPFKGEARYFVNAASDGELPVAWMYPSVFDEVSAITGYIAFYNGRVELRQTSLNCE